MALPQVLFTARVLFRSTMDCESCAYTAFSTNPACTSTVRFSIVMLAASRMSIPSEKFRSRRFRMVTLSNPQFRTPSSVLSPVAVVRFPSSTRLSAAMRKQNPVALRFPESVRLWFTAPHSLVFSQKGIRTVLVALATMRPLNSPIAVLFTTSDADAFPSAMSCTREAFRLAAPLRSTSARETL